jgi:hypothetical protein
MRRQWGQYFQYYKKIKHIDETISYLSHVLRRFSLLLLKQLQFNMRTALVTTQCTLSPGLGLCTGKSWM